MNLKKHVNTFTWESEVRDWELDIQGIVSHANYLYYFQEVRARHLLTYGVDWKAWHDKGLDFVLYHVDIRFLASLVAGDQFAATSCFEKTSRLKITFNQTIRRLSDDTLIAKATNTLVCVNRKTARPVWPAELDQCLSSDSQTAKIK